MSEQIVNIQNMTKDYGTFRALDDVSVTLERGKIYGFIGENGAGKTTLIRMLAGLSTPTRGTIELFGKALPEHAAETRNRMGFMVEHPIYHDGLSARDNLKLQMKLHGQESAAGIPALLDRVGLEGVENRRLKDFSLGMKQRLGIAMALANDPELLVLDEPVNGLDPVGMVEVRRVLQQLNREEQKTIFLSSHILLELYQLATDYIIIHQGKILKVMTLDELNHASRKRLVIGASDPERIEQRLRATGGDIAIERDKDGRLVVDDPAITGHMVGQIALEENVVLDTLSIAGDNLEEYYLKLIGGYHA